MIFRRPVVSERAINEGGGICRRPGRSGHVYQGRSRAFSGRSAGLTRTEFNDQSIEDYVWRLCQAATNGLVPVNCNVDMTPSTDSSRVVSPSSITLYIGQHFQLLRLVYPNDEAWKGLGAKELPGCGDTFRTATNYREKCAR